MPTIEPATPTGRYVLEHWEDEGGPDPTMLAAILKIEAEASATELTGDGTGTTAAAPDPVASPTCLYCGGRRWTEDENWSPDDPATWRGERSHGDGLIPCGGCNQGGWSTPDYAADEADPVASPNEAVRLLRAMLDQFDYWSSDPRPAVDGGTVRLHKFGEVQPEMERVLDEARRYLAATEDGT